MNPILRALRYRNYRLFFGGQSISVIGTWLTRVATSWLVYRLTHSAFWLGFVGFIGQLPTFAMVPLAGVLVDRWNRQKILVITQALLMFQALALAALSLTGTIRLWHIVALSMFQGLINSFDIPARQSFVVEMVTRPEDLGNAIALNSSMFNAARLIGPAAAGILIAAFGEGICFLVDGISYGAVILSLVLMKVKARPVKSENFNMAGQLKEGWDYTARSVPIRTLLLLVAWISLTGMAYIVLLPVVAQEILKGGAGTLGMLTSSSGLGALSGGIYLASRKSVLGLGKRIAVGLSLGALGLILVSFAHSFTAHLACIAVASFGLMLQMASSNTVLQTIVDDDKRGRVMSFYTMAFLGVAPFGSLLAGAVASHFGVRVAIFTAGMACTAAAAFILAFLPELKRQVRPIYVKKGIIPELARGIQAASQLSAPEE